MIADRVICGGCGSSEMLFTGPTSETLYGLCRSCGRLQEAETRPQPCQQLCDNCAYRPGSDERADPIGWALHRERHVETGEPFYCHKGLPIEFDPRGHTHVIDGADTIAEASRKPCAGWLAHRLAHCLRQTKVDGPEL